MQTFKKVISSILVTVIVFAATSVVMIESWVNSEYTYFLDRNLRKQLAGQIDCIIIGASHAHLGIDTRVMDEKLDCFSYNLSASMLTMDNKYYLV